MFKLPLSPLRKIGLFALIALFMFTGFSHLYFPNLYVSAVPPYLPLRYELAYISGILEIVGATGLIFAKTRRIAGIGLILLLIAIFPANIHMALNPHSFPCCSPTLLYLRLPLQIVIFLWIYWATIRKKAVGYQL